MIWVMMAFLITIIIVAYFSNSSFIEHAQYFLMEQGYINESQIGNITQTWSEIYQKVSTFVK